MFASIACGAHRFPRLAPDPTFHCVCVHSCTGITIRGSCACVRWKVDKELASTVLVRYTVLYSVYCTRVYWLLSPHYTYTFSNTAFPGGGDEAADRDDVCMSRPCMHAPGGAVPRDFPRRVRQLRALDTLLVRPAAGFTVSSNSRWQQLCQRCHGEAVGL